MPKFYHTFSESRNYSVCCEAPDMDAARKLFDSLDPGQCHWDNTSYENLQYFDEQRALDCLGIKGMTPDFIVNQKENQ